MNITITKEILDESLSILRQKPRPDGTNITCSCPISLALQKATGKEVRTGGGHFETPEMLGVYYPELPPEVKKFVHYFDNHYFEDNLKPLYDRLTGFTFFISAELAM